MCPSEKKPQAQAQVLGASRERLMRGVEPRFQNALFSPSDVCVCPLARNDTVPSGSFVNRDKGLSFRLTLRISQRRGLMNRGQLGRSYY